ncbi:exosortase/archaeosortase family protein [Micromonospora sp. NPDC050397]|uniref:exosortase/archaeosortase family protein n=1 Tax=Micromonospora sp. NPDC050397 TaxID=3364279 RepID=UPI00384AC270
MTSLADPTHPGGGDWHGRHRSVGPARGRLGYPLVRVLAVLALTVGLGWWAAVPVSHWEAGATAWLAQQSGLEMTRELPGTNLVHGFYGYQPYFIRITPSCSALTVSAAAAGVSLLILGGSRRQRVGGALFAVLLLSLGNLTRLVAVLWVGRGAGIPTMITFHDWVGTVFSYALLIGVLLVLVAVRLPGRRAPRSDRPRTPSTPAGGKAVDMAAAREEPTADRGEPTANRGEPTAAQGEPTATRTQPTTARPQPTAAGRRRGGAHERRGTTP